MMFKRNLIRAGDPFQLSLAGRCHAAIAWLRGPALMRRWLLFVLVGAAAVAVAGVISIASVMQSASPTRPAVPAVPGATTADLMRSGPTSSEVTVLPGYDCHPEPNAGPRYVNPLVRGPVVVVMDKDGVVWGPDCVVTYGTAGS